MLRSYQVRDGFTGKTEAPEPLMSAGLAAGLKGNNVVGDRRPEELQRPVPRVDANDCISMKRAPRSSPCA